MTMQALDSHSTNSGDGHTMDAVGPLPSFGSDTTRVSGYSTNDKAVVARVFTPLELGHQTFQSWQTAANTVGSELTATTRWSELLARADLVGTRIGSLQRGTINAEYLHRLVDALEAGSNKSTHFRFAIWEGYAGELSSELRAQSMQIPKTGSNFLSDGSFYLHDDGPGWARNRSAENGFRFAVAVWPADHSFVLAAPIYSDSYYVSCDRRTLEILRAGGLEVLEILRESDLPSEGD